MTSNAQHLALTPMEATWIVGWSGFADKVFALDEGERALLARVQLIAATPLDARACCGLHDPTNHGTCRMNPGHLGMHVGPVNGRHEAWHDQNVRKEGT